MNESNQSRPKDELIQKLTQIVHKNLNNEQFGVSELAEQFGMNRSHLYRKVLVLTKKSLSQFIREIRLTEALKLLNEESVTVSEVAYRVGFNNPSYFNTCFHDHYGFPPGEAKQVKLDNPLQHKNSEANSAKHRFPFAKKYAFIALFFLLVIVSIATVIFLKRDKDSIDEKSIAVLPFTSLSDDPEKQYLADAMMTDIQLHLSKIEDLRVMARTSVEQYRETDKTASMICRELDVAYLLEGSFQKDGDQARLIVQLVRPGIEGYIWSDEYDRNWKDIFSVQSEVAQIIARELQAVITPEEKQLIEKIPTTSLKAYDFYQRGREELEKFLLKEENRDALYRAEDLYQKALEYDSTFALAYTGLAHVYWNKHYWETFFTENFLDSVLMLADIALSYDDQLADAYEIRGDYYEANSKKEQAIKEYNKAIKFNPNSWEAYLSKGNLYHHYDYVEEIDNYLKAASVYRGPFLPSIYRSIGMAHSHAGFQEKAIYYVKEALKLDADSANVIRGNYYEANSKKEQAIKEYDKAFK